MKSIRTLIVSLVVVMSAALLVAPTFAQDNPPAAPQEPNSAYMTVTHTITVNITQDQINARLANRPGDRLADLKITLGDNQVTVSFTTKPASTGGTGKAIVGVVTPSLNDGKINWTLSSLTIDGTAATQEQIDNMKERVIKLVGGRIERLQERFTVTQLNVSSSAITLTATRSNKDA